MFIFQALTFLFLLFLFLSFCSLFYFICFCCCCCFFFVVFCFSAKFPATNGASFSQLKIPCATLLVSYTKRLERERLPLASGNMSQLAGLHPVKSETMGKFTGSEYSGSKSYCQTRSWPVNNASSSVI